MMFYPSIECPVRTVHLVWVYILQTADGAFYVGQSRDVHERLRKHRLGLGSKHTADHREPRLVYVEGPLPLSAGIARERQLKRWSRAKKIALITGNQAALHRSSESREAKRF
jgi:putative endonuclease